MDSCNIKVAIKARPLNNKEQSNKVYWKVESNSVVHIDPVTEKKNGEQFFFDRVFCGGSTNYDVFDEVVKPIIDRGVQGFNGTVFAYGQTASGKTYTMSGDESNPGIIPLAINYMFNAMNSSTSREYLLRACYLEIYNETVIDLLEKKNNKSQTKKIEIQKDGLHITPLKAVVCQNAQMVIDLMKIGEKNRSIGETNMNERSSRSHTIFRIILESRNVDDDNDGAYQQSVINLVDLAGSERSSQTQSSMERFKEGCKINSSLTSLALVIQQLSECPDSSQHISFRDSKLTRILQTSLGGNSLTAIICTVTLAVEDQTQYTLSFASRAKKIKNTAKVNENVTDETLLKRYRVQLCKLKKELEGIKQNQYENNEVNEIKYKYQEEKRTNEELKDRIMRLQNSMITSSAGQKDQTSNKKGYKRRRTWGGKLDNTMSSNSILETIEEDVNAHRPSVPSNFGNQNKEFKTPLEPFEWDLIREEDYTVDSESINNDKSDFSPPPSIPFSVCETPKKVLRERVNNYKSLFEMSMKENTELREFTTLEKQMFDDNNEQLKDLNCLKKQVDKLQNEKNESAQLIEKLKKSVQFIENEKRDVEVCMDIQKNMYEKRENELLATIQESREELKSKAEQLKKVISNDTFMTEKQEEIKRLEIKIKEMSQLNNTYINEVEILKSQLLLKDQLLKEESSKHSSILNEFALLQNNLAEVKSIPYAIQYLADNGYFTLKKCEIEELDKLLEHVHNTVEQLHNENQSLKDENNNLKLITSNFTDQMKNIERENDELRSQFNLCEANIKSIIKEFSANSEIDVDNSNIDSLIEFAARHFEKTSNEVKQLHIENDSLKLITSNFTDQMKNIERDNDELRSQLNLFEANIKSIIKEFSASSEIDIDNSNTDSLIEFAARHFEKTSNEVEQLHIENDSLKLITRNFTDQMKNIERDNDELRSQLNLFEANIKSVIKEFSASSEIDVDNSNTDSLIDFAARHFEKTSNEIDKLSNGNMVLKDQLSLTNQKLCDVKSFVFDNLDGILQSISTMEVGLINNQEIENFKKQLTVTVEENVYLKSSIQAFDKMTMECVNIADQVKTNRSNIIYLQEELAVSNAMNKEFKFQIEQLDKLNNNLSTLIENQTKVEKEIQEELVIKSTELKTTLTKLEEMQGMTKENETNSASNNIFIDQLNTEIRTIKSDLKDKSNLVVELEKNNLELLTKYEDLERVSKTNAENVEQKDKIEMQLQNEIKEMNMIIEANKSEINNLLGQFESVKSELNEKNNDLQQLNELINKNFELMKQLEETNISKNEIHEELLIKTKELENALSQVNMVQLSLEEIKSNSDCNVSTVEKLKSELNIIKLELEEKSKIISDSETDKLEATKYHLEKINELNELIVKLNSELEEQLNDRRNDLEQINELNNENVELMKQLEETNVSKNKMYEELLTNTKKLEDVFSQVNMLQLTLEEMKSNSKSTVEKLNVIILESEEKSKIINDFEKDKQEATKFNSLEKINELNEVITKLQSELEEKSNNEEVLKNELEIVFNDLDDATTKIVEVKSLIDTLNNKYETNIHIIEQLTNELQHSKSTLDEKINLIVELETTNSELLTKCKNSEVADQLNKITVELEMKIEDKTKIEKELQLKTVQLENALTSKNEVQTLVESLEKELKFNIVLMEEFKSELATKSNLVTELEIKNCELLLKYETDLANKKENEICYKNIQDQLEEVIQEKALIEADLNLINQKFLEVSKHHRETKLYLEDALQLQVLNYQKLYSEFVNISNDIESLLELQISTESKLREDILLKSTELELFQNNESSLQQEYDKLEEEYMSRSRECDDVKQKIVNLESLLLTKEESEKVLKINYKSKCIALEEYKKNVEFLFSRNDSFQVRVNDFEDNVLVDLNEEFDSLKSELAQKTEYAKSLLVSKTNLECNLNELQEKFSNINKELELSEERSEDLASIINVLVIEIKDANSVKQNLELRLNEAEHEILKLGDLAENLEYELCHVLKELENECIKAKSVESNFNEKINKKDLEGRDVRNQLFDPLVDYVHDIKLKLTELNSAMISGNQSEKQLRTKVMSVDEDILPFDDTWKTNYSSHPNSPDVGIGLEIDNLRKILQDKIDLINTLQKDKVDAEKIINELQDQMKKLSDENSRLIDEMTSVENNIKEKTSLMSNLNMELNEVKIQYTELEERDQATKELVQKLSDDNVRLIDEMTSMENNLKEKSSLVSNLNIKLNDVKIQYRELEEHNQATKDQIHHSFDVDLELRDGKKNLINEINLLEPGKITGVLTHHSLCSLLDTFVNLIMTKEQQIVTGLVNEHNKNKQQYEDQIKQFQEDIKKAKEWQEQVECDNEKLCLELENLKSEKHNFPNKLNEIKELKEKVLEAENQSFNYLSELDELKSQIGKISEQNYQTLLNEFKVFKTDSEQSIQSLKNKIEELTNKYNDSMSMYNDQKSSICALEGQIEKAQSECTCLKTIVEQKDEDIKNLLDQVQLKTQEYKTLIEKNSLQRDETNEVHDKKIDELQLELNNKTQEIYRKEKLLKEVTKNYNQLLEENSSNLLKMNRSIQNNDNTAIHAKVEELECDIQTITEINKTKIESLETELKLKCLKLKETETKWQKLVYELDNCKSDISAFEKQLESCYQSLKLKDNEIEKYQKKLQTNDDNLVNINNVAEKLRKIMNCSGTLSTLYENIGSLIAKCKNLEEENEELKLTNANLDNECESMLSELKSKDDRIVEFLTLEEELRHNNDLITEERNFLKTKCEQFKNVHDDVKKLNDEICGYEQNIYQLRKEKGQLIVQHDKELKQLKTELTEVHAKNLELMNEYQKLSETAKNLEKSLKEDIQQLNRCIVDKNAKISTLELLSKTNTDELKKKYHEMEHIYKRVRDENHMLRKELRKFKEIANTRKADQTTQTEEQSVVSGALMAANKSMTEKITKLENDNQVMRKMLHHRKAKMEALQKQIEESRLT